MRLSAPTAMTATGWQRSGEQSTLSMTDRLEGASAEPLDDVGTGSDHEREALA